jgi:hypothetical protein
MVSVVPDPFDKLRANGMCVPFEAKHADRMCCTPSVPNSRFVAAIRRRVLDRLDELARRFRILGSQYALRAGRGRDFFLSPRRDFRENVRPLQSPGTLEVRSLPAHGRAGIELPALPTEIQWQCTAARLETTDVISL